MVEIYHNYCSIAVTLLYFLVIVTVTGAEY